jgi:hypothetical protein
MPLLGILHLLIAIAFVLHAHRTGRPQFWYMILIFLPLVGSIAYVLFELLPEAANSRRGRQVAKDVRTIFDPDRDWREKSQRVQETDAVDAKLKLAQECERRGMWGEALGMYRKSMQGIYADDPELMRGLARAELGAGNAQVALDVLDRLQSEHPKYQHQDAHLTYARALEALDRLAEAETDYRALIPYFVGAEARTRFALLLQKTGRPSEAAKFFQDVAKLSKARGVALTPDDREWIKVAQRNLPAG